jgi:hypothetical protein
MKSAALLLLSLLLLFCACQKEKEGYGATLSLKVNDSVVEVEWAEVIAGRSDSDGSFYIDAQGANDESFQLSISQLRDTGTLTGLTLSQLRFSDGLRFQPRQVVAGSVTVSARTARRLSGTFQALFADSSRPGYEVKAAGSFVIYGEN